MVNNKEFDRAKKQADEYFMSNNMVTRYEALDNAYKCCTETEALEFMDRFTLPGYDRYSNNWAVVEEQDTVWIGRCYIHKNKPWYIGLLQERGMFAGTKMQYWDLSNSGKENKQTVNISGDTLTMGSSVRKGNPKILSNLRSCAVKLETVEGIKDLEKNVMTREERVRRIFHEKGVGLIGGGFYNAIGSNHNANWFENMTNGGDMFEKVCDGLDINIHSHSNNDADIIMLGLMGNKADFGGTITHVVVGLSDNKYSVLVRKGNKSNMIWNKMLFEHGKKEDIDKGFRTVLEKLKENEISASLGLYDIGLKLEQNRKDKEEKIKESKLRKKMNSLKNSSVYEIDL